MNKAISIIFLSIASLLFNNVFLIAEAHEKFEYSYPVKEGTKLEVYNQHGNIILNTWNKDYIKISGMKISMSWKGEEEISKVNIKTTASNEKNNFMVETEYSIDAEKVEVQLELQIPENILIDRIETNNGKIKIERVKSDLNLISSKGRIYLHDIVGNIKATSGDGSITLNKVVGDCDIQTSNGRIDATGIKGNLNLENLSGSVSIENTEGNINADLNFGSIKTYNTNGSLNIKCSTGGIDVETNIGNINLITSFGHIKVDDVEGYVVLKNNIGKITIQSTKGIIEAISINGDIDAEISDITDKGSLIRTDNGSIKAFIAEDINAELEVDSMKGNVTVNGNFDVKNVSLGHFKGILGKGGPKIFIKTRNGKIEVSKF